VIVEILGRLAANDGAVLIDPDFTFSDRDLVVDVADGYPRAPTDRKNKGASRVRPVGPVGLALGELD
jgi:hypothetical protein